jgi:hypothetical protein
MFSEKTIITEPVHGLGVNVVMSVVMLIKQPYTDCPCGKPLVS